MLSCLFGDIHFGVLLRNISPDEMFYLLLLETFASIELEENTRECEFPPLEGHKF